MTTGPANEVYRTVRAHAGLLTLADVGEKRLLDEFLLPLCREACGDHGLGDDGGIVALSGACDIIVSTDRVPTDLLARRFGLMSPEEFGRYVVRVNVSDLVAMGATPMALVIAAAFPPATLVSYVVEMMWGCYDESRVLGASTVGGDTKSSAEESVSACAIGTVETGRAVLRGPIRTGDLVYVTGALGRAGAALRWFGKTDTQRDEIRSRLEMPPGMEEQLRAAITGPRPRTDLLPSLRAGAGITGCMDITDGLGQSLEELAHASQVQIRVDAPAIPMHPAAAWIAAALRISPLEIVGGIGIDLELVLVTKASSPPLTNAILIGKVMDGSGVTATSADGSTAPLPVTGFEHFRQSATAYLS
jgi:thiamine-monophosphate kinase